MLIAIGALAYFGVLSPDRWRGNQTTEEISKDLCVKYCNEVEDMEFESCSIKGDDVSVTCFKDDSKKRVRLTRVYLLSLQ